MKSPWLIPFSRPEFAAARLFCFPYAGGSAHVYRPWAEMLSSSTEVIAIQAPGKGGRMVERPCSSVAEIIDGLLSAMEPVLREKPFSFFGHSNGALIAFELCAVLQERNLPLPEHLFLSASPAPWTRTFGRRYSQMDDEEFIELLKELKGTPPGVLADRDLLELVLPGLRADFALSEKYRYARAVKLTVPTTVFYGEEDEIGEEQIFAWQEQIEPTLRFERIAGGHFFIHSHLERLTALVRRQMTPPASYQVALSA